MSCCYAQSFQFLYTCLYEQKLKLFTYISVDNKMICDALDTAKKYYDTSTEGREFVEKNLAKVTEMLLSQSPRSLSVDRDRFGLTEHDYVEKGLRFAIQLANADLRMNGLKFTATLHTLDTLKRILDYKDIYYQENSPEVRMDKILVFQRIKGFYHLAIYFNARAKTSSFPEWELVHRTLTSSYEGIVSRRLSNEDNNHLLTKFRNEAKNMAMGCMKHLKHMKEETFETLDASRLSTIIIDIKQLYLELALGDPKVLSEFFDFCKVVILQLLPRESLEYKQCGQNILYMLIENIHSFRPTIGSYYVTSGGCDIVNGLYKINPTACDDEGYIIPGVDIGYERVDETTGKKLMIFLDTTFEEGEPAWCLSEEHNDEREPEYTDYYTAAIDEREQRYPPLKGWEVTECSEEPPPTLQPQPSMIPIREEHKTLKEDLSRWLLEKKVFDLVVGTNISALYSDGTVSTMMEALDAYIKASNFNSNKIASLFISILPSIGCEGTTGAAPQTVKHSSSSMAALDAAKQRLASAERWENSTSRALQIAQTEHIAATAEVQEARAHLDHLHLQYAQSQQNEDHDSFSYNEDSAGSNITSATGVDDNITKTPSTPRERIRRASVFGGKLPRRST